MLTRPPDVSDGDIADAIAAGWGRRATHVEYAPVGFGSHHWAVTTPDGRLFATLDDLIARRRHATEPPGETRRRLEAALNTARALRDAGLEFAVAPLTTRSRAVVLPLGDRYGLALYPHIAGKTHAYGRYADDGARHAVLGLLIALHRSPAVCRASAALDDLTIDNRGELLGAIDAAGSTWDGGPHAEPSRRLLARHAAAVLDALAHHDALARAVRARPERLVLTHGEPHPANTITTPGGVVLIDWDTALVAPPERDLWGLLAEDASVGDRYRARTGTTVDGDAVALYRLGWDLAEIAVYIRDLRAPHVDSDDTREAQRNLTHVLDPLRWARRA